MFPMANASQYRCVLGMIFLLALSGCAKRGTFPAHVWPKRLAAADIRASFMLESAGAQSFSRQCFTAQCIKDTTHQDANAVKIFGEANRSLIKLQKNSLGKAFLFSATHLPADNTPMPEQMLPKVVSFETNGDEVALYELNLSAIYQDLPSAKLLQTFPIVDQDRNFITFKWIYGLKSMSVKPVGYLFSSPSFAVSPVEEYLPVLSSFLKRVEFVGNQLEIDQISQTEVPNSSGRPLSQSVRIRMTLSPYRINSRFAPQMSAKKNGVGFFEIAQTRKGEGDLDVYAVRWDLSPEAGPITYLIAKNTPAELVSAVEEGILYWNQVAGREIVRVEKNADVSGHPAFRKVPVYWITWNKAPYSMASFQPDPLNGEILGATIFLASSFQFAGPFGLRHSLEEGISDTGPIPPQAGPVGFSSASVCQLDTPPVSPRDLTPENLLRATQDSIRLTVAHEVGHTLGLTHNFAGSVASELESAAAHQKAWREYIRNILNASAIVSSTVMDYFDIHDHLLLGAAVREKSLAYDRAVMQWAYTPGELGDSTPIAKSLAGLEIPPFCSDLDAQAGTILGCAIRDSGRNPLDGYAQQMALDRKSLVHSIINAVISVVRAPHAADRRSVKDAILQLQPEFISAWLTENAQSIFMGINSFSTSMWIDRKFNGLNWLNQKSYLTETREFLTKELEQVQGLPGVLRTALGLDHSMRFEKGWLVQQFNDLFAASHFGKGVTWMGNHYDLSEDEIHDLKTYLPQLAERFEEAYLRDTLLALTGRSPLATQKIGPHESVFSAILRPAEPGDPTLLESPATDQWQEDLAHLAEQLILETDTAVVAGSADGDQISVPSAKFSIDVRLAAARLLNPKVFGKGNWAVETRNRVIDGVKVRALLVARELSMRAQLDKSNESLFGLTIQGMRLSPEIKEWISKELFLYVYLRAVDAELI